MPTDPAQPVADIARRQLFMAKVLCARGGATASSSLPVDRIEGVLLLEKAIETTLNAIVDWLGGGSAEPAFPALWKAAQGLVAKQMRWELPFKAGIDHIHYLRTGVQHHGQVPSREDGSRAAAIAYEFTREVASHVFHVDVDVLALPGIVRDEEVAKALSEASTILEEGDSAGSVKASARAFEQLWLLTGYDVYATMEDAMTGPYMSELAHAHWRDPLRDHFSQEQSRALQGLREVLVEVATALTLGVRLPEVRRFRALAGKEPEAVTRDEALFALDFALNCALRSESVAS